MHDTPLGRIVSIRQEDDKDIIKNYGAAEKKIRSEWTAFRDSKIKPTYDENDKLSVAAYFERLFVDMLG